MLDDHYYLIKNYISRIHTLQSKQLDKTLRIQGQKFWTNSDKLSWPISTQKPIPIYFHFFYVQHVLILGAREEGRWSSL